MAALMTAIAEAICFVEAHAHTDPHRRTRANRPCRSSLNIAARVFGQMRAQANGRVPGPLTTITRGPSPATLPADDFGAWLRGELAAQGLSNRGLANLAGLDHSTVSRLARSKRAPLLATAKKIEEALTIGGSR